MFPFRRVRTPWTLMPARLGTSACMKEFSIIDLITFSKPVRRICCLSTFAIDITTSVSHGRSAMGRTRWTEGEGCVMLVAVGTATEGLLAAF